MTNVQLYIAGSVFGVGDPFKEVGELVTPNIAPRTGYYEIRVPDGIYRVTARFDEATTAQLEPISKSIAGQDADDPHRRE